MSVLCVTVFILDEPIAVKHFLDGYPFLMLACAGFLELRWSAIRLLKSAICRSWSKVRHFVRCSQKLLKIY